MSHSPVPRSPQDIAVPPAPVAEIASRWPLRLAVVNLVMQILIVVTGGAVRLTGSGLGCSVWPECEPGSLFPVIHDESGIHPYIEFGNRMLGIVVGFVAIATFLAVWRWARDRTGVTRDRRALLLATGIGLLTGFQGLLGGITVRTGLTPVSVITHFLVSMVLIVLATALVHRLRVPAGDPESDPESAAHAPRLLAWAGYLTAAIGTVVIVLGTLVTATGPHGGDETSPRLGLDLRTVSWLHADSVMLFCGLVIAMVIATRLVTVPVATRRGWLLVLWITLAQAAIGYTQYFTGVPEILVGMHMLGAAVLVAALSWAQLQTPTEAPGNPRIRHGANAR